MKSKDFWEKKITTANSLTEFALKFLHHMKISFFSKGAIKNRRKHLQSFIIWCQTLKIETIYQVSKTIIQQYQTYLSSYISPRSQKVLAAETRKNRLTSIKYFFLWLTQNNYLIHNPADEIELPKTSKRLPRNILTAKQMKLILSQPDTTTNLGIRDRTILEVFYATAIRREEIVNITLSDLNLEKNLIYIIGKGGKNRYVPLTIPSIYWLNRYINEARPKILKDRSSDNLFVGQTKTKFHIETPGDIVRKYFRAAGLDIKGACHVIRHSTATLMLENGADIRYIMELLGHSKLSSTQIYTKVSISKLKEIHTKTHPGKMKPTKTKDILEQLKK